MKNNMDLALFCLAKRGNDHNNLYENMEILFELPTCFKKPLKWADIAAV